MKSIMVILTVLMMYASTAFAQVSYVWSFRLQTAHGVSVQTVQAPNQFVAKDLATAIANSSHGKILGNVKKVTK